MALLVEVEADVARGVETPGKMHTEVVQTVETRTEADKMEPEEAEV